MSKDEMKEIFRILNAAYGNDKFSPTEEACEVWFDIIGDLPFDDVKEAARRFIRKSEFPPTIAGIMKEYDGIVEEHNAVMRRIYELRDFGLGVYPCSGDFPEAEKMFVEMADGSVKKAQKLADILDKKTDRMDDGTDEYENIVDYMNGIKL